MVRILLMALMLAMVAGSPSCAQGTDSVAQLPLPVPTFDMTLDHATNSGTIQLVWSVDTLEALPENLTFELIQAADSLFETGKVRYNGPDMATYISGLKNGAYYFRVRTIAEDGVRASAWSETAVVVVEHHSLSLALTLAGLGGLVFLLTVAVVAHGTRTTEREHRLQLKRANAE